MHNKLDKNSYDKQGQIKILSQVFLMKIFSSELKQFKTLKSCIFLNAYKPSGSKIENKQ